MAELAPWAAFMSSLMGAAVPVLPAWPEHARRVVSVFGESPGMYDELLDLIDQGVTAPSDLAKALGVNVSTLGGQLRKLAARGVLHNTAHGEWHRAESFKEPGL